MEKGRKAEISSRAHAKAPVDQSSVHRGIDVHQPYLAHRSHTRAYPPCTITACPSPSPRSHRALRCVSPGALSSCTAHSSQPSTSEPTRPRTPLSSFTPASCRTPQASVRGRVPRARLKAPAFSRSDSFIKLAVRNPSQPPPKYLRTVRGSRHSIQVRVCHTPIACNVLILAL